MANAFAPFDYNAAIGQGTQNALSQLQFVGGVQAMQDRQQQQAIKNRMLELQGQAAQGDQNATQQLLQLPGGDKIVANLQSIDATTRKQKAQEAQGLANLALAGDTAPKFDQLMSTADPTLYPTAKQLVGHFDQRDRVITMGNLTAKAATDFTLNPGQTRYNASGKAIVTAPGATNESFGPMEQVPGAPKGTMGQKSSKTGKYANIQKPDMNNPANIQVPGVLTEHGTNYLNTLSTRDAAIVKALAEGRQAFPAGFALKSPYWQTKISEVAQYDPGFDAVNYQSRYQTRKEFTSGKYGNNINAMNTVIGHLKTLSDAADALNNSNFLTYNRLSNFLATETGDPRVRRFNTTRKAVVDELTRVYRQTGGSEQDIKTWSEQLNAANSPAQLHGVIAQIGDLLESKLNALGAQYTQGMGTTEMPFQLITPKARKSLTLLEKRAGVDTTQQAITTLSGDGQTPDTNQTPQFSEGQTATNPQTGQKIIFRNGQWVPMQ